MSVYIKGMEMPKSCGYCPFENHADDGYECRINGCLTEYQKRPSECPLIPVPDHGDLIDRDALCDGLVSNHPVVIHAKCAPTIIPADGGGDTSE